MTELIFTGERIFFAMKSITDELALLKSIMRILAEQLGESCEIVLHDWSNGYSHSIIDIINGHVTGRKIGDCGSNLGLEVMRGTVKDGDCFNYITQTKSGKTLRSSTVYIKDDQQKTLGALCINQDITDLLKAKKVIDSLTLTQNTVQEVFVNDINEILDFLLLESTRLVGKQPDLMTKEDKLKAMEYLDEKGAFLISKAGNKICKFFDISKFTLYNYLDEIRSKRESKPESSPEKVF